MEAESAALTGSDIPPVAISTGDAEFGQVVRIIGKGATGNGATGGEFSSSHRTALRRACNKVSTGRTPGRFGQISCNVRLSHYQEWIAGVLAAQP